MLIEGLLWSGMQEVGGLGGQAGQRMMHSYDKKMQSGAGLGDLWP